MKEIEFEPDLSHCIQTLAKGEYDRIMRQLIETGEDISESGERLETLKVFLESTDFSRLRSEYEPYLIEGKRVIFRLCAGKGETEYRMEIK